jgi:transcription initiation factor IIF auxiliary subunit
MASFAQGTHTGWGQANAEFVIFYFPGDADTHIDFLVKIYRSKNYPLTV